MKKLACLIIWGPIIYLFLMLLVVPHYTVGAAPDGVYLAVSEAETAPGEEVMVSVTAENASGITGGEFVLRFNPGLVKALYTEAGELITDASDSMHMSNLQYAEDSLKMIWLTPHADSAAAGVVCRIAFAPLGEGTTRLELEEVVFAPDSISLAGISPGRITVGPVEVDEAEQQQQDDPVRRDDEPQEREPAEHDEIEPIVEEEAVPGGDQNGGIGLNTGLVAVSVLAVTAAAGYFILVKPGRGRKIKKQKES